MSLNKIFTNLISTKAPDSKGLGSLVDNVDESKLSLSVKDSNKSDIILDQNNLSIKFNNDTSLALNDDNISFSKKLFVGDVEVENISILNTLYIQEVDVLNLTTNSLFTNSLNTTSLSCDNLTSFNNVYVENDLQCITGQINNLYVPIIQSNSSLNIIGENIFIGDANSTVRLNGNAMNQQVNNVFVTGKILYMNYNTEGTAFLDNGVNSGIQINGVNGEGYIKTNENAERFYIKAPENLTHGYIATTDVNNNFNVTGGNITTNILNTTHLITTNVSSENILTTNITSTNMNITNTLNSNNIISTNISGNTLNSSNINCTNITSVNIICSNNYTVNGNIYSNNIQSNNISSTNIDVSNNITCNSLTVNNDVNVTGLINSNNINSNNVICDDMTITSNLNSNQIQCDDITINTSLNSYDILCRNNLTISNRLTSSDINVNTLSTQSLFTNNVQSNEITVLSTLTSTFINTTSLNVFGNITLGNSISISDLICDTIVANNDIYYNSTVSLINTINNINTEISNKQDQNTQLTALVNTLICEPVSYFSNNPSWDNNNTSKIVYDSSVSRNVQKINLVNNVEYTLITDNTYPNEQMILTFYAKLDTGSENINVKIQNSSQTNTDTIYNTTINVTDSYQKFTIEYDSPNFESYLIIISTPIDVDDFSSYGWVLNKVDQSAILNSKLLVNNDLICGNNITINGTFYVSGTTHLNSAELSNIQTNNLNSTNITCNNFICTTISTHNISNTEILEINSNTITLGFTDSSILINGSELNINSSNINLNSNLIHLNYSNNSIDEMGIIIYTDNTSGFIKTNTEGTLFNIKAPASNEIKNIALLDENNSINIDNLTINTNAFITSMSGTDIFTVSVTTDNISCNNMYSDNIIVDKLVSTSNSIINNLQVSGNCNISGTVIFDTPPTTNKITGFSSNEMVPKSYIDDSINNKTFDTINTPITFDDDVTMSSNVIFESNITVNNTIVSELLESNNIVCDTISANSMILNSNLSLPNDIVVDNNITLTGNISVDNIAVLNLLDVNNSLTSLSNITVTGNCYMDNIFITNIGTIGSIYSTGNITSNNFLGTTVSVATANIDTLVCDNLTSNVIISDDLFVNNINIATGTVTINNVINCQILTNVNTLNSADIISTYITCSNIFSTNNINCSGIAQINYINCDTISAINIITNHVTTTSVSTSNITAQTINVSETLNLTNLSIQNITSSSITTNDIEISGDILINNLEIQSGLIVDGNVTSNSIHANNISATSVYAENCYVDIININQSVDMNNISATQCNIFQINCNDLIVTSVSYTNDIVINDNITVNNGCLLGGEILLKGIKSQSFVSTLSDYGLYFETSNGALKIKIP